jgi:probable addiction module antidote protein
MVTVADYDVVDYLDSEEAIAGYLEAVLDEGGPDLFAQALPEAARARTVLQLARETGIDRTELCSMLSAEGNDRAMTPEAAGRLARAFAVPV